MSFCLHIARTLAFIGLCLCAYSTKAGEPVAVPMAPLSNVPASKPVRTLRDLRYRDMVRQNYDFSCGSAALASLLKYGYGMDVTEAEMIKEMLTKDNAKDVLQQGFSMLDMKHYVEKHGMRGHGFRIDMQALRQLKMPVITLMEVNSYKHFVIVKGASGGRVMIADPALGHRVVYEDDFVKNWNGIVLAVVDEKPFEQESFLANDRTPRTTRYRASALVQSTVPVPLVELGLMRADLF